MNFSDPRFWLEAAVLLITSINSAVLFVMRPGREAQAAVQALAERLAREREEADAKAAADRAELVSRVQHVEDHLQHMPTDEELATLRGDVHSIKAQLEGQRELLKRVEHQTQLIHEHLLRVK